MVKKIKKILSKLCIKRTTVLFIVFAVMFFILLQRLFVLQIIKGEEYATNFNLTTTKTKTIKSTRGNIRDRNGELLAHNQLAYSVIIEDNGTYDSTREKNLTLNHVAYEILKILEENGESVDVTFHITLDENGEYAFDTTDFTLDRFKADVYGQAKIDDLSKEEAKASAARMIEDLSQADRYGLVNKKKPYTEEERKEYGLPESFTKEEALDIIKIRYALAANSFQKYMPATIATNVSETTMAAIMEEKDQLQGVDIQEDSIRVYEDSETFAPVIGYTGKASSEELDELKKENSNYSSDAVIGKTGMEQYMELQLQGTDGEEKLSVDNLGKVLKIDESSKKDPISGNDVYLTIDKNLQKAAYQILEQKIAGILASNIISGKTFDKTGLDSSEIRIPIYDVYNALIENSVIDISHFKEEDASETEKAIYSVFSQKQSEVFDSVKAELTVSNPEAFDKLPQEMQDYQSYIVNDFLINKKGILSLDAIDASDATYIAWSKDHSISLKEFLTYAASQNWIDISQFYAEEEYLDSSEVYDALSDYLTESLTTDSGFSKIIYKYMLQSDLISGTQLCLVLYDQGVLEADEATYSALQAGQKSSYDFMLDKINSLEITPAQLALDPCSGSMVVTNVKTGEILACVTYPGYDNNRLTNDMDTEYYAKLALDQSSPFFNKATQQTTAPGSTLKLLSTIAGMEEGIIDEGTYIDCTGQFDYVDPPINCWNKNGHGALDIRTAIEQSCNYFFNMIGFQLGKVGDNEFSEVQSLSKLQEYASLLGLDRKTGIELSEATPKVSDAKAVPSYMGQGNNLFTTAQLARYATVIATSGNVFKLTLLDKVSNPKGEIIEEYTPEIEDVVNISSNIWDVLHDGMRRVIQTHTQFDGLGVEVAGKTGTAELDLRHPNHGLFVGYAPASDPEYAVAIRIANGYSSGNACLIANDVFKYIFNLADEDSILTGYASTDTSDTSND